MVLFYLKLTSLNDFALEEGPISLTEHSLDSLYYTDSPLSGNYYHSANANFLYKTDQSIISHMPMFYLN